MLGREAAERANRFRGNSKLSAITRQTREHGRIEPSCNLEPTSKPTGFVQLWEGLKKKEKQELREKSRKILQQTLHFVTFCSNVVTGAHIFGMASISHATGDTHLSKTCCSKSAAPTAMTRKCLHRAVGLEDQTSDTSVKKIHKGESVT